MCFHNLASSLEAVLKHVAHVLSDLEASEMDRGSKMHVWATMPVIECKNTMLSWSNTETIVQHDVMTLLKEKEAVKTLPNTSNTLPKALKTRY